jgi:orotate phosphoribosyltransferase
MNKKDELRKMLFESGAIKFGEFVIKSGKKSNYYVDMKWASCNPKILDIASELLKNEVKNYDRIGGILVDGVPLATMLSAKTGIPMIIVRPEKQQEIEKEIEGEFKADENVVLVDGVITTAGTKIRAVNILKKVGLKCNKVLVVIDRESGSDEIKKYGIKLVSLFNISDVIKQ